MNTKKVLTIMLLATLIMLALPGRVLAAPAGKFVMGDTYTLESGEVLNEDLVIMGGNVRLEVDSIVVGDVIVLGGNLHAAGVIEGDLAAAGGNVYLQGTATVKGDFTSVGAQVERDQGAEILGEINSEQDIPFDIVPDTWQSARIMPAGFHSYLNVGWVFLRVILWGLLAMLLLMFLPDQTTRVSDAIKSQPLVAVSLGLATGLILPILLIVLAITICLIPISLVGFLLLALAWAFGIIALGLELGKRFGRIFNQDWQPALAAGVGTFLLTLVLNGFNLMLPCLGWLPQLLAGAVGLGGVMLTRFGTQDYPPAQSVVENIEPPAVP